jgi:mRNA interferase RelE/StbE
MALFKIVIQREAEKELRKLPPTEIKRVLKAIAGLSSDPYPHGFKKLVNSEFFRIRVGNYRIVYGVKDQELIVYVLKIGHRKDVYR